MAGSNQVLSWMRATLVAAAAYNMLWGGFVILFPQALFHWAGMAPPRYAFIWQCVGMVVGVYGIGYAVAAVSPLRHWPIVLVRLLGKILGPVGFLEAAWSGKVAWSFGWTILANDVIWWIPFGAILVRACLVARAPAQSPFVQYGLAIHGKPC